MKILLLPITLFIWFMAIWWSISLSASAFLYLFSLSWLWIIFVNIIGGILLSVLTLMWIKIDLSKLICYNLFVSIIHTLAGVIGVFLGIYTVRKMHIPLWFLWELSWIKCLLFIPMAFLLIRNIIIMGIFYPIMKFYD